MEHVIRFLLIVINFFWILKFHDNLSKNALAPITTMLWMCFWNCGPSVVLKASPDSKVVVSVYA